MWSLECIIISIIQNKEDTCQSEKYKNKNVASSRKPSSTLSPPLRFYFFPRVFPYINVPHPCCCGLWNCGSNIRKSTNSLFGYSDQKAGSIQFREGDTVPSYTIGHTLSQNEFATHTVFVLIFLLLSLGNLTCLCSWNPKTVALIPMACSPTGLHPAVPVTPGPHAV